MINLLVVLQSHSRSNNQKQITRYMCDDKAEISYRCIKSLVASINHLVKEKTMEVNVHLQVLDDHSDDHFLQRLNSILEDCDFSYKLHHLETYGIMPSILACYEYGRDHGKDLVYFAQDDYLYYETCIYEMVDAYFRFTEKSGLSVCIYPFDDPYRYGIPPERQPMVTVHLGIKRHWRTAFGTASCFMLDHPTLLKNFDLFDAMGNHAVDSVMEDETINKLFRERSCLLFTPIPSIALHAQADTEKDLYIDWRPLWDKFAESDDTRYSSLFHTNKKIVLNIGAGKTNLNSQTEWFDGWKELRVDVADCSPDIVSDITTLKGIPNKSVDAIWASHVVEHVYFHQLKDVFENMVRVLKDDGYAIIRVPDLGAIAHLIQDRLLDTHYESGAGPVAVIDMIYGHRGFVQTYNESMAHKTGFTKDSMSKILGSLSINALVAAFNDEVIAILYKDVMPTFMDDPKFRIN